MSSLVWGGVYGGYGVMVSTRACGAFSSGSNPDSHPRPKRPPSKGGLLVSLVD